MGAVLEKLEAVVAETTFRNEENGYTVLRVGTGKNEKTVVGILPELSPGENVVFEGTWTQHAIYGEQFSAKSCSIKPPSGRSAIIKYLGSGLIRGIGTATAKLIVDYFGDQTLEIMDTTPQRLTEVSGIGKKRAAMIAESYLEQMGMRRTLVFLQNFGISPNLSMKITKYYGESTIEKVRENPYRMVMDIDGVGFLTADRIALSMGMDPHSDFRVQAALHYLLTDAASANGHTYLPCQELTQKACEMLKAEEGLIQRQISQSLMNQTLIAFSCSSCDQAICLPAYYYAESETAFRLTKLKELAARESLPGMDQVISAYEKHIGVKLNALQKEAIHCSVSGGVSVITGGPGTGKTTIIRCILHLLDRLDKKTVLCAPTGRAAKRMQEATGREAKTIHRLLEYGGEEGFFAHDQEDPLKCDCVIVDEMSMVDIFLMRALLRAIPGGAMLIMVGDSDQLPSVGAGNVLRDILDSSVIPTVRLTEIFRQSEDSMIAWNANRINQGEMPELRSRNTDFFFVKHLYQNETAKSISELYSTRLPKYLGIGTDCSQITHSMQVLSPMKKGDCGAWALNRLLQNTVNPPKENEEVILHGDTQFRLGDKVIQTKNDYKIEYQRRTPDGEEEGVGVFNGDVGYVVQLNSAEHMLTVCFDEDRYVQYQKQQLDALELAYCLTVHKSQGSEFPVVILPVVSGPPMLMARNLLYTAVTRAKKLVVLVGKEEVIQMMVANNYVLKRYTTLCDRLKEAARKP